MWLGRLAGVGRYMLCAPNLITTTPLQPHKFFQDLRHNERNPITEKGKTKTWNATCAKFDHHNTHCIHSTKHSTFAKNDINLIKTSINSRKTKQAIIRNAKRRNGTFVLNGLALVGRGALPYGPAHEDDEFFDAGPLEVAEVAHVRSVCEDHRIGRSVRVAFQHQQRRDLHLISLSSLDWRKGKMGFDRSLTASRWWKWPMWGWRRRSGKGWDSILYVEGDTFSTVTACQVSKLDELNIFCTSYFWTISSSSTVVCSSIIITPSHFYCSVWKTIP